MSYICSFALTVLLLFPVFELSSAFSTHTASNVKRITCRRQVSEDKIGQRAASPEAPAEGEQAEETVYYNILSEDEPSEASPQQYINSLSKQKVYLTLNGWYPKEDFALWGLPGAIAPTGFFDPLGFARRGLPLNDAKRLREAEVQHGRVAMMAAVGFLAGEAMVATGKAPFGMPVGLPAIDHLQQVPLPAMIAFTIAIASAELYRAKLGWVEPEARIGSGTLFTLRDNYYPGDLGFDPLGFKPKENYDFQRIQTAELSNGRLAMFGWIGMASQELVNHKTIGDTVDFYLYLFNGGDPYQYYTQ